MLKNILRPALAAALVCLLASASFGIPDNWARSFANVLVHEGGYINHPRDPGGRTLHGVTQVRYDAFRDQEGRARRLLTPAIASERLWLTERDTIYKRHYAEPLAFEALPSGVDYVVLDYGVNSGPGRAGKVLRCAVQTALPIDECVRVSRTWAITDPIIEAVMASYSPALIRAICDERFRFLKRLPTWDTFGGGWSRRVNSGCKIALNMAGARLGFGPGTPVRVMTGPGKAFDPDEPGDR